MPEILVMTSRKSARPPVQIVGWGSRTASGDGSVRAIFLGGKSRGKQRTILSARAQAIEARTQWRHFVLQGVL